MPYTITWETWKNLTLDLKKANELIEILQLQIAELKNERETAKGTFVGPGDRPNSKES